MRRKVLILLVVVALLAVTVVPALAITDGEPDKDGHPYVGLMVAKNADGNVLWRCSGTLISPTIFLTAGHCTEAPAASAAIWFDSGYPDEIPLDPDYVSLANGGLSCEGPDVDGYPCEGYDAEGTTYTHPQYNPDAFYLYDLGVVVLDEPVEDMVQYGALPQQDVLDQYKTRKRDVTFTAVGYGLQQSFPDAASWKDVAYRTRMVAYPRLIQINTPGFTGDFSILLSNNANTGGTCYGDSGGPNFIGDTNIVGGVTSFGMNGTCGGTGGVYRVDRADDLDWLATFGVKP
jgi:hypothetical protein